METAIERAGVGLWSWSIGEDSIRWSPTVQQLYGQDEPPSTYEAFLTLVHPEDRDRVDAAVRRAVAQAVEHRAPGSYLVEHRVVHRDGTVHWIEVRGSVEVDGGGRASRITGVVLDCTPRKEVELALQRSEETFRLYAELASDYVYQVNLPELAPDIVAGSFERTTGMTTEDVAARGGWPAVIHPDDQAIVARVMASILGGQPSVAEYRIVAGDDDVRWLRDRIRPVVNERGETIRIRGAVQDVTEQKRLEEQLLAARKSEALARFSGGVAHDFNNLLTVILGATELLMSDARSADDREMLGAIEEAAEKAAELTRSLLLFAGRNVGSPRVLDVQRFLERTTPLLRRGLASEHELVVSVEDAPLHVRIDESQLQLLLLNLVVNAGHAMANRPGRVELSVCSQELEEHDARRPPELSVGTYVTLVVRDEGDGIPPEVMPRIFEPFFTTRELGKGTGLGLAACQGIATQANGAIVAESQEGVGATFTVMLPRATEAPAEVGDHDARVSAGGTERLLVVEDERALRDFFCRALHERGYRVTVCATAEDALEVLERERFDMVVTDVVMPGRGGLALADEVSERWPETRVLLVSGTLVGGPKTRHHVLLKPVAPAGLARRVRELLDQH